MRTSLRTPLVGFAAVAAIFLGSLSFSTAAQATGETPWMLLAAGERASVLAETMPNAPVDHNGSAWYYAPEYSFGFAQAGASIEQDAADVVNGNDRLSWHAEEGNMDVGYRIGDLLNLNESADYTRAIYQADTLPTYYPFGPQHDVLASDFTGWTLCYSGTYDVPVPLADLWAACTGNYLLYAGGLNAAVDVPTPTQTPTASPTPAETATATATPTAAPALASTGTDLSVPLAFGAFLLLGGLVLAGRRRATR
jgi:hypothetical protein